MRENFTRVLKGHIALATARFPKGTTGSQLDGFARRALWQVGLDYDHGTGHGVGSYLSVHEGPQRISKAANTQPLLPGMIVSNEPGYYKTGAYGIRIENLIVVQPYEGSGRRARNVSGSRPSPWRRSTATLSFGTCSIMAKRRGSTAIMPGCGRRSARWSTLKRARGWRRRRPPIG